MIVDLVIIMDDGGSYPDYVPCRYIRRVERFITNDPAITAYISTYGNKLNQYYCYYDKSKTITPKDADPELAAYILKLCNSVESVTPAPDKPEADLIVQLESYCD